MKYMGIDFGSKRIGIAVSDDGGNLAFPYGIQNNTPRVARDVSDLIQSLQVEAVVCGLSTDKNGEVNKIDAHAKEFVKHVQEITNVPVIYEWEGYSSGMARSVSRAGSPRGVVARKVAKPKDTRVDAHAAMLILQSYLDKINYKS